MKTVKFESELLTDFANTLLSNGFRLLVPVKPSSYFHFEKDGKLGYCQVHHFGGLGFSTVHKPTKGIGTGYGLQGQFEGIVNPTIQDAETAFIHCPSFDSANYHLVKKYRSLEEYQSQPINKIIHSEIIEANDN